MRYHVRITHGSLYKSVATCHTTYYVTTSQVSSMLRTLGPRLAASVRAWPSRGLATRSSKSVLPPLPALSLPDLLFSRASKFGSHPALIDGPSGETIR